MPNVDKQVDTLFTTSEPIIVSEEPLKEKPLLKKITSDIAGGIKESRTQVRGGFVDAVNETGNAIEDFVKYTGGEKYKDFELGDWETYEEPKTVTGGLVRGVTQFVTGFIGAGKITKPIKLISKAGGFTKAAVHGAIADSVVFDPQEGRLSDLIESNPALHNPITTYLKSDPNDSRAEGRFKNAIEGLGLGFATEGLFRTVKILKKRKNMDVEFEKLAPNVQTDILKAHKGMQTVYMVKDDLPVKKYPWDYGETIVSKSGVEEVRLKNPINKETIIDITNDLRPIAWGKHYQYAKGPYNIVRNKNYQNALREPTVQTDAITGRHREHASRTYWDVAPGYRKPLTNKQYTFLLNEYIKKGNAEFDRILLAGDKDKQILPLLDDLFKSETKTQKVTLEGIRVPESLKTEWGTISKTHIKEFHTRLLREVKDVGNEFLVNMSTARLTKLPVKISEKPLLDIQLRPKAEVGHPRSEGISSSPLYKSSLTLIKKMHQKTPLVSTTIEDIKRYAKKMRRTKEETDELVKEIKAQNIATIESKELIPLTNNISISRQRLDKVPSVKEYIDKNRSKIVENRIYKKVDKKFENVAAYIEQFHLGDPDVHFLKHGRRPKLPALLETEFMPFSSKELKKYGYDTSAFDMGKFVGEIKSMGIEQKMAFAQKAFDFLRKTWVQGRSPGKKGMRYVKGMPKELSDALEELVFQAQFANYIIDTYHGLGKDLPIDFKKGVPLEGHMTENVLNKLMKGSIIDMDYKQAAGPEGVNVFDYPILIPHSKKYQGLRENARVAQKIGKQPHGYTKYMSQSWKFDDF